MDMENKNGKLISHVPTLMKARKMKPVDLIRRGFGTGTAYAIASGSILINLDTVKRLCAIFGVPIQEVVEYIQN